eukprot:scpid16641/ scgid5186/ Kinesin-like protein KIF16B; Sorting nexin-23
MSVKVAVRVRPLNSREKQSGSQTSVMMTGNQTWLYPTGKPSAELSQPSARLEEGTKKFTFDHSFWSCNTADGNYVSQEMVFDALGKPLLESVFKGYNTCLFAYGQTSAGKSYSMMGEAGNPGLIPRVSQALFDRVTQRGDSASGESSFKAVVSYLEIYNERVRDLLVTSSSTSLKAWASNKDQQAGLKVREHPKTGPYVEGLSQHSVTTVQDIMELIECGNSNRTTASTLMNSISSRSHSIFTINFSQATISDGNPCEMTSRINLVDLAGSERVQKTAATGDRLKEGANINKSLTTLGLVISNLATNSAAEASTNAMKQKVKSFIPYRDSVLTWLLKDSLGGNAMTVMLAAISPADVNHGETLSTLRYAHRAKSIVNKPTVNEDANVRLIRELRAEIALLRQQLPGTDQSAALESKLLRSEKLAATLTQSWEAKWDKTQKIIQERSLALTDSGVALHVESEQPYLIALAVDRLSTGVTICNLKEGTTSMGAGTDADTPDITLAGPNVLRHHCRIESKDNVVMLHPAEDALCLVDNCAVSEPTLLTQGCLIQLASQNLFRYNNPTEAARLQSQGGGARKSVMLDVVDTLAASVRRPHISIRDGYLDTSSSHSSQGSEGEEDMTASMQTRKDTISAARKQLQQEKEAALKATQEAERVKQELEGLKTKVSTLKHEENEELRVQLQQEHREAKAAEEAARKANEELHELKAFIQQQRQEFEVIKHQELQSAQWRAQEAAAQKAREDLEELRNQLTSSQRSEKAQLEERLQKERTEVEVAQHSAAQAAQELEVLRKQLSSKQTQAEAMKSEIEQRQCEAAEAARQASAALVELERVRNDFVSKEQSETLYQERLEAEQEEARKVAHRAEEAQSQLARMQQEFTQKSGVEEELRKQFQREQEEVHRAAQAASTAQVELEKMRLSYEQQLAEERRRREEQEEAESAQRELDRQHLRQEEERQRQELAERQKEIETLTSQLQSVTQESTKQQQAHSEQLKQRERDEEVRLHQQEQARLTKEKELRSQLERLEEQQRQQEQERKQQELAAASAQSSGLHATDSPTAFPGVDVSTNVIATPSPAASPQQNPFPSTQSMDDFTGFAKQRAVSNPVNGFTPTPLSPINSPRTASTIGSNDDQSLLVLSSAGLQSQRTNQFFAQPIASLDVTDSGFRPSRQSDLMAFSVTGTNGPASPLSAVDEFDPLAAEVEPSSPLAQPPEAQNHPAEGSAAHVPVSAPDAPLMSVSGSGMQTSPAAQASLAKTPDQPEKDLAKKRAAETRLLEDEMRRRAESTIRKLAADQKEKLRRELHVERQQMTEDLQRREDQIEQERRILESSRTASMTRSPAKGTCDLKLYLSVECRHNLEVTRRVEITADNTCAGYMTKQGGRIKSWKKRYFVLNPQRRMLTYYTDHLMRECKGKIYFDAFQRVYGSTTEKKTAQEYVSQYPVKPLNGKRNGALSDFKKILIAPLCFPPELTSHN